MIVDYNYKYLVETPATTGNYTIQRKNNKGLIYIAGDDGTQAVYPYVNFYSPNGSLIGMTLGTPTGSFFDFYTFQFKVDFNQQIRSGDINLPTPDGTQISAFLPICYHSLIFNMSAVVTPPTIITLY